MHIRVYGVQADEMSTYEEAKVRYGFTFEFEAVPLSEKTAGDVKDCDALILLTNCIVNEPVAKVLASAGVPLRPFLSTLSCCHLRYCGMPRVPIRR